MNILDKHNKVSPLIIAFRNGAIDVQIIRGLVDHPGVDLSIIDPRYGHTALHFACMEYPKDNRSTMRIDHALLKRMIMSPLCDHSVTDAFGNTFLHYLLRACKASPTAINCPMGHILQLVNRDNGWLCDASPPAGQNGINRCKNNDGPNGTAGLMRYRCAQCDFDYCGDCYEEAVAAKGRPEKELTEILSTIASQQSMTSVSSLSNQIKKNKINIWKKNMEGVSLIQLAMELDSEFFAGSPAADINCSISKLLLGII